MKTTRDIAAAAGDDFAHYAMELPNVVPSAQVRE
jgi:hypothetical protein